MCHFIINFIKLLLRNYSINNYNLEDKLKGKPTLILVTIFIERN